jgi:hypothetical protein
MEKCLLLRVASLKGSFEKKAQRKRLSCAPKPSDVMQASRLIGEQQDVDAATTSGSDDDTPALNKPAPAERRTSLLAREGTLRVIVAPGSPHCFVHTLRIEAESTAKEAADKLVARLRLPAAQMHHFGLIAVYRSRTGLKLSTLRNSDCVEAARLHAMSQLPQCEACHSSSGSNEQSCLQCASAIRWYFKDSRAAPLEFDEDVSGSESDAADDSTAGEGGDDAAAACCSKCDIVQAGQGDLSDYLLVLSDKDPNLWRKRWCMLAVSDFLRLVLCWSIA